MADIFVDGSYAGGGPGPIGSDTNPYNTIQAAVDAAVNGDTVYVAGGTYNENVTIDISITLQGDGRATTTIVGSNSYAGQGTVYLPTGVNDVTVSGFTIVGFDGTPGVERAAIYLQGDHTGVTISDNEVVANGDAALSTEWGGVLDDIVITGNEFSGQTFLGANPSGDGSSAQFTLANVPRQLVVVGGNDTGAQQNVTFTNNLISGTAGGTSTTDNSGTTVPAHSQGNNLVTIDAANSVVSGNTFTGYTNGAGTQLRVREENTDVTDNNFSNDDGGNVGVVVYTDGDQGEFSGNGDAPVVVFGASNAAEGLTGSDGDDYFVADSLNDTIDGGNGSDTIDMTAAGAAGSVVNLNGFQTAVSSATGIDLLNSIENVVGSAGGDVIIGQDGVENTLSGKAGADIFSGLDHGDTVDGGADADKAVFDVNLSEAQIVDNDDGTFSVTIYGETVTLTNVGQLQFNDGTVRIVASGSEFTTIQAAVDASSDGDTILLTAGTYREQVTIDGFTDLTIRGMGDGTVVEMPDARVDNSGGIDAPTQAVFAVINSSGVTLEDFKVDARGLGPTAGEYSGIFFGDSSGTIDDVTVTGVHNPKVDGHVPGNQQGRAINVRNTDGDDRTVVITNNTVEEFQKNGIDVRGDGLTATISGNTITGDGLIDLVSNGSEIAQNGIVIGFGATGTVSGNTVTEFGNTRTDAGSQATGILSYEAGDGVNITGNTVTGALGSTANGIVVQGETTDATVTSNAIGQVDGGVVAYSDVDGFAHGGNSFTNVNTNLDLDASDDDDPLAAAGTTGADSITGTDGDDTIEAGTGNDTIDGGDGEDEVVYNGVLTANSFTYDGGVWSITGTDGSDTLTGVERVVDVNGKVFLLVGQDGTDGYEHIQDAIDAAIGGETILIAPGTYTETEEYVTGNFHGLYINTANLTLVGFSSDTGSAVTSAEEARDFGPTVIAGDENMFGANHWIDVGGTGTTITGLHLQAGTDTTNKLLEIWADDTSVTDSFIDVFQGGTAYTGAIAVYYNEDGNDVSSYEFSDNILNEGIMVANGVGNTGSAADQKITGNAFEGGADRYDTITLQGDVNGVGWLLSPIGLPTITGNTLDGNATPFLLRFADDNLATNLSLDYIEDFLANNTDADTTYAYTLTSAGDLRLTPRDYDPGVGVSISDNYYVMNSIDSLNLGLDTAVDPVFGGQRITQQSGDTVIVQSGSGAVDSQIMVNNLTVKVTANSADLDLMLATTLADGSAIAGGGVQSVTLADYATGLGANVDVTGNLLANTIKGNSGNNALSGGSGNDSIEGGAGADSLTGGDNDDSITGGDGNDTIDAGNGIDTVVFEHDINEYTIQLVGDTYAITRNGTVDTVKGAEFFNFNGTIVDVQSDPDAIENRFDPVFSPPTAAEIVAVAENVDDALVYDANATDADNNSVFGPITYTLEGTDAAAFVIDPSNGQVRLVDPADRETKASYSITVRATQGQTSETKDLTVNVTDANDNAPVISTGGTASVMEGTSVTSVIYDAAATDADTAFGPVTFSLGGADASAFNIDAGTGQVRLNAVSDFETRSSYNFSVIASQGASSSSRAVALSVINNPNEDIAGVGAVTAQAEAGSTAKPLGTLSTAGAGATFLVQALSDGGGAIFNGNAELAVGQTLTLAQLNALTFNSVTDGFITFTATEGSNSETLQVTLDVTAGVSTTYTGTGAADRLDGADGNDEVLGMKGSDELLGGAGKDTIEGGKGHDTIYGGAGKDSIEGGKGDDVIHGGTGRDTLDGGAGRDKFVFDTALSGANADVIKSFVHGTDKIALDADIFAAIGGSLGGGEFRKNTSGNAQDASDRIIYETDTGELYYDANGSGAGQKVLIAVLDPNISNLARGDFEIV